MVSNADYAFDKLSLNWWTYW